MVDMPQSKDIPFANHHKIGRQTLLQRVQQSYTLRLFESFDRCEHKNTMILRVEDMLNDAMRTVHNCELFLGSRALCYPLPRAGHGGSGSSGGLRPIPLFCLGPGWARAQVRSPSVRSSAPQVDVMRSALKGHHGDLHPSLRPPERQTEDPKTQQEQVFKKVLESPDTHWHIYVHWPPNNGTTLTDRQSYASPNPAPQTRLFQTPSRVDEGVQQGVGQWGTGRSTVLVDCLNLDLRRYIRFKTEYKALIMTILLLALQKMGLGLSQKETVTVGKP